MTNLITFTEGKQTGIDSKTIVVKNKTMIVHIIVDEEPCANLVQLLATNIIDVGEHYYVIFSRGFYDSLTEMERFMVFCHEVGHLLRRHLVTSNMPALKYIKQEIEADAIALTMLEVVDEEVYIDFLNKLFITGLNNPVLSKQQLGLILMEWKTRIWAINFRMLIKIFTF